MTILYMSSFFMAKDINHLSNQEWILGITQVRKKGAKNH